MPGQLVDIQVAVENYQHTLTIPREAVNQGPDGQFVYTVDAKHNAQMVPVTVLNDDGTRDAVKGNLKAGDSVITDGQLRVQPGKPVAIQKPGQKPGQKTGSGARRGGARAQ